MMREVIADELRGIKSLEADNSPWQYGQKHDVSASLASIGTGYAHGPGGLLTFPGVDPDVFSTMIGAYGGVFSQIPANPSVIMNPVYEVLTGVYDASGSEKAAPCDAAPIAGLTKAGKHTAPFGAYARATRVIDLMRLGQRNDRADPMDLRLRNSPAFPHGIMPNGMSEVLNSELGKAMFERAVAFQRLLATQLFIGNSSNNNAGGGYKELNGFDKLIATGYVDAETNTSLPSLDSYVADYNHGRVDTTGTNLVNSISNILRQLMNRAGRANLMPVRWIIAMREELFWEVTKVWPCAYYLGGCVVTDSSGQRINIDAKDGIDLRDQMRAGKFLLIDGVKFDVVFDSGINEDDGNSSGGNFPRGCFESDIYFIPMSVLGGSAVTFMEYFDFSNSQISNVLATRQVLGQSVANGMFFETVDQTRNCLQFQAEIRPRLVMRTPWLAAKLQNVVYCPIQHTPDAFPTDAYWVNGGSTSRTGPSYYGD
jgi:hypothetical protein